MIKRTFIWGILVFIFIMFFVNSASAITQVSGCVALNTDNEIYNLTGSFSGSATCFTISADNMTFLGNGHTVTKSGGAGSLFQTTAAEAGSFNFSVYDVYSNGFDQGFLFYDYENIYLKNFTVVSASFRTFYLRNITGFVAEDVTYSGTQFEFNQQSRNVTFINTTFSSNLVFTQQVDRVTFGGGEGFFKVYNIWPTTISTPNNEYITSVNNNISIDHTEAAFGSQMNITFTGLTGSVGTINITRNGANCTQCVYDGSYDGSGQFSFEVNGSGLAYSSYSASLTLPPADPVQNISACGTYSDSGIYYTINESINAVGACLIFTGSDLIIDGAYNLLNGSGTGTGISINTAHTNISIYNLSINYFDLNLDIRFIKDFKLQNGIFNSTSTSSHIFIRNITNGLVENVNFIGGAADTILLSTGTGTGLVFKNNSFKDPGQSPFDFSSADTNITIINNNFINSSIGHSTIFSNGANSIRIISNNFIGTASKPVISSNSNNLLIKDNNFTTTSSYQYLFGGNNGVLLEGNTYNPFPSRMINAFGNNMTLDFFQENFTFSPVTNISFGNNNGNLFLDYIDSSSATQRRFNTDIILTNNFLYVNETNLNTTFANVSLYNLDDSLSPRKVFRNGVECPASICTDISNLNYISNVSFITNEFSYYSINQSIPLFDNCSNYTDLVLEYNVYDEDTQSWLSSDVNSSIQLSIEDILAYNNTFELQNPVKICKDSNLTSSSLDYIIQYQGNGKVKELYNQQNYSLSDSTTPINLSLYSLAVTSSQEFLITVRDENFLFLEDAVIDITRRYLSEGVFKTVERPLTDFDGNAIGHFVLNDEVYTINILKENQLLATFSNIQAFCDDVAVGDCRINLNIDEGLQQFEISDAYNLSYSAKISGRTYTVDFVNTDGVSRVIDLNLTRWDQYNNLTVCTNSVSGISGSVSCTVPDSFGNITVNGKLYSDGNLVSQSVFDLKDNSALLRDVSRYILAVILIVTLPLLAYSTPEFMLFLYIIGIVMAASLGLISVGGWVGPASAFVWFIIASAVIIWKISRREG